jgi:16S rRNA processing protein RimM
MTERRVCVGVIVGAHGVKGEVRVKSFTAEPGDVTAYGPMTDADGARRFEVEVTGSSRGVALARIEGVDDRDAAEALKGTELYVPRDALPPAGEDEFYHADLIGLAVELEDGSAFGAVKALHDFGAGEVIEIATKDGPDVVLPFTRRVVPVVDLEAGRVVIAPPAVSDAKPEGEGEKGEAES